MTVHPGFPPVDNPIETFLPMKPGQDALAMITCGQAHFTFRAETPLAAKAKARAWLAKFWSDKAAGKHKRGYKEPKPAPADAPPSSVAPPPSEDAQAPDGGFSSDDEDIEGAA